MNYHQILNLCIRFLSIRMFFFNLFARKEAYLYVFYLRFFTQIKMTSKITAFFKKTSSLSKLLPAEELTPPASQNSASSDSSFRLELLPSQESVASDSSVESKQNV